MEKAGRQMPESMRQLQSWLQKNLKEAEETEQERGVSIVHGDFKLDNIVSNIGQERTVAPFKGCCQDQIPSLEEKEKWWHTKIMSRPLQQTMPC